MRGPDASPGRDDALADVMTRSTIAPAAARPGPFDADVPLSVREADHD